MTRRRLRLKLYAWRLRLRMAWRRFKEKHVVAEDPWDVAMTPEEHRARHVALHQALDELAADFICHAPPGMRLLTRTTVMELMEWSYQQTLNPTELEKNPAL